MLLLFLDKAFDLIEYSFDSDNNFQKPKNNDFILGFRLGKTLFKIKKYLIMIPIQRKLEQGSRPEAKSGLVQSLHRAF